MLIPCPLCGPRDALEFRFVDETVLRPEPQSAGPEQWRSYLYLRANRAGAVTELWLHRSGCRQYVVVERDSLTNTVTAARLARKEAVS